MTHPSIEQIHALIESLGNASLSTQQRVQALQEIRRMSVSLYLNRATQDTTEQCHQIDALALKACGIALTSQQA